MFWDGQGRRSLGSVPLRPLLQLTLQAAQPAIYHINQVQVLQHFCPMSPQAML